MSVRLAPLGVFPALLVTRSSRHSLVRKRSLITPGKLLPFFETRSPPDLLTPTLVTLPSMSRVPRAPFFFLLPSYFLLFLRPSAASPSKSSAEVCARLHRDGARNPPKYSRSMDTPPDSPPAGGNENACTSR